MIQIRKVEGGYIISVETYSISAKEVGYLSSPLLKGPPFTERVFEDWNKVEEFLRKHFVELK